MKFFKSHFWYNKSQRNGILFLIFTILILQLVYVFVDFSDASNLDYDVSEIKTYQAEIDSLKKEAKENHPIKIYPFNPNYLTDFKAYQLGLNVSEIDRLIAFRKTGKFVNSSDEFQKVTGINDSLFHTISPFFKFPDWVKSKQIKSASKKSELRRKSSTTNNQLKDLNLASSNDLRTIKGIGDKLSKRIITYRNLLHGYSFNDQLYEVYYLDKEVADLVLKKYIVMKKPAIKKININEATFKEILRLPYIDYDLTKKIYNFKNEIGAYSSLEDLKKIDSFPLDKYDRIALYLTTD